MAIDNSKMLKFGKFLPSTDSSATGDSTDSFDGGDGGGTSLYMDTPVPPPIFLVAATNGGGSGAASSSAPQTVGGSIGVTAPAGIGGGTGLSSGAPAPVAPQDYRAIVTNGGITFNLTFTAADNPTANFETDVENAAKLLSAAIKGNYTINLTIGYGEVDGQPLTDGSAAAGPTDGPYLTYSSVRAALVAHAPAGDPNFAALPTGSTIGGQTDVLVSPAEEKALGFLSGTATEDDGDAGFATDISDSLMVGVALHELTHALGRVPFADGAGTLDIFEFTRFSSPGVRVSDDNIPGPASYFSIDGGNTKLADYGQDSDPSDFANPDYGTPLSNLTPEDAFNQYYDNNTLQTLTQVDLTQLDVLGLTTYIPKKKPPYDFNGDGSSDILWRNTNSAVELWDLKASGGFTAVGAGLAPANSIVAGVGDFNGDGMADIVWRNTTTGAVAIWDSNGSGGFKSVAVGGAPTSWTIAGVGDFNGDGLADILWQNTNGAVELWDWKASGGFTAVGAGLAPANSTIAGIGDFNGDGMADIVWRNTTTGAVSLWDSNGSGGFKSVAVGGAPTSWRIAGVGDFNGDHLADLLWQNTNGAVELWDWKASGGFTAVGAGLAPANSIVAGVGDFNGDGLSDILWRNTTTGAVSLWDSNGSGGFTHAAVGGAPTSWTIQGG